MQMPTMNVSLTAEMAEFVEEEVASGDYATASEVVRDALRMMRRDREDHDVKMSLLREHITDGLGQASRREFSDRTAADIARAVLGSGER
jgi:antitoxin ParD1/3/4